MKALKDGTDPEEVASQYMVDSATYSGKETLITTKKTDISTRMINKLYKTKKLESSMKFSQTKVVEQHMLTLPY